MEQALKSKKKLFQFEFLTTKYIFRSFSIFRLQTSNPPRLGFMKFNLTANSYSEVNIYVKATNQ